MNKINKSVDFEIKEIKEEGDFFKFFGLASTFGNTDLDDDVIVQGAFAETLKERTPLILWQHNTREPIGMPESIKETDRGLEIVGRLPKADTFVNGRVIPQMKVGSVSSMSIGFSIDGQEGATRASDGTRIIRKVKLFEVSLVSFPANPMATVSGFKSEKANTEFIETLETVRELEGFLIESKLFTKSAAKALISKFSELRRDAGTSENTNERRDAGKVINELNQLKDLARCNHERANK